ncbi:dephospho-CoA kinase [Gordonia pseudamarae]|uniref:Dephospho-CoA kinase n=1 Tax=Gordonia pseudamarae TaxID=2831662 RepID=A0ABX6II91_9ACTN|nr:MULTISPECIES: dephospho-CoA kinase [Gordonia]MBD0022929.1 dephospho-CoA kinase [Gordonia sp. (in: high G+C Gram-positive bacteria)]QHN26706.1 dephospho-CoA kinase [Gordonia pseudamarae]QHN35599.1 dephospho-CoA kinase [Gordonia pseudamarae]
MIRVGLTGGIGAGKSTVAATFAERGGYLIDADKIAREVVAVGSDGLRQLVEAFGADILAADGSLDRPALAAKAFSDDEQRQKLNSITHPLIGARTQELLDAAGADAIVVQDIPLLVENHSAPFFHIVVIVGADAELRVHRLTTSRGLDEQDARARIAAQATDEQRRAVADAWLDNSSTPDRLAEAAARLWDERLVPLEAGVRLGVPATPVAALVSQDPNPASLGTRLTNRLWALCGANATAVEVISSEPVTRLRVTARAGAEPELEQALPPGGFVATAPGEYASADPGRPAVVTIGD